MAHTYRKLPPQLKVKGLDKKSKDRFCRGIEQRLIAKQWVDPNGTECGRCATLPGEKKESKKNAHRARRRNEKVHLEYIKYAENMR